ncbi:MAG: hypothetical protein IJL56_08265 [Bacteroidales bacterium]|nr:hypothetical protein [Bacteroidales bacterium]
MKRRLFLLHILISTSLFAQEKKPTLMILPSDGWCTQRYFMTSYDNQGLTVSVPDYQAAFREDLELRPVVSKVGEMLTNYGYSLKDCEQELKAIAQRAAEDNMTMSKTSGASLIESPLDMLKRRTKSDIIVQVDWHINREAAGKSVTYTLEAFDSYTSKRIATSTGTGNPSDEPVPVLLEKAVNEHVADFDHQMDQYYRDLVKHGREIILTVRCWDSWENDLETEYAGEELTDCIQSWMHDNTVGGVFNLSDATESFLQFEQVRIPFFDEKGRAMDARSFANELRKYLRKEPFQIEAKVMIRGLGEAIVVLGEK